MENTLQITKDKVLEAASKCSTTAATLKVLFPEAFENEPYKFDKEFKVSTTAMSRYPVFIGNGCAPDGLEYQCLIVHSAYDMETQQYEGRTILVFRKK